MGPTALPPLRRKASCRFFITLKNPSLSAGLEPANLVSNGIYDIHYTTEDDSWGWRDRRAYNKI
jgi:hypothetical protein